MDILKRLREKAKVHKMTIVLPEHYDTRVPEAARIIQEEGIANAVVLTKDAINPADKESYIQEYFQLRQHKGIDLEKAKKLFEDPVYYAAMMVRHGKADGFVAGSSHKTADVARAAIHCIGMEEDMNFASSCFIMTVPNCPYAEEGTFIFADCGVIPEPNARQLACIALASAQLTDKVLGLVPRVAMLSYSTKGSAESKSTEKILEALQYLKEKAPSLLADGELQVDTAIVPEVANIKYPNGVLGGKANILVFPNLEAGNISYKLVERLAGARAIGPLFLGLRKPCSDLSRGCSVEDIVDCVAATAIRAH